MLRFQIKGLSMTDQSSIYQKPFWVVSLAKSFIAAFTDKYEARRDADARNKRAKEMGSDYGYHVIDRPS